MFIHLSVLLRKALGVTRVAGTVAPSQQSNRTYPPDGIVKLSSTCWGEKYADGVRISFSWSISQLHVNPLESFGDSCDTARFSVPSIFDSFSLGNFHAILLASKKKLEIVSVV